MVTLILAIAILYLALIYGGLTWISKHSQTL